MVSAPDIADRVTTLVDHARAVGDDVVWVLHQEPGSGGAFDPELGHVRLLPGLEPAADDIQLTKTAHNAFTTTDLQQQLEARGVTEVVVAGIRTEQCCETTARVASDLGYAVTFVLDATATHPHEAWDGGIITPAEIQRATASALAGRFATITTIALHTAR